MNIKITVDDIRTITSTKTGVTSYVLVAKIYNDATPTPQQIGGFQVTSATKPTAIAGATLTTFAIDGATNEGV